MVWFRCENCGHKFNIPQDSAGKKSRCPKCKNTVVPGFENTKLAASQTDASEISSKDSILDPNLFDIPQKEQTAPDILAQITDEAPGRFESEPLPERKLPWFIDIFLYPLNRSGLTMIGILVGVPFLMKVISGVLGFLTNICSLVYLFYAAFVIINLIVVNTIIACYRYWFIGECVRNSAEGQIRASETIATTPGLEVIWSFLRIFVCIIIFVFPFYYYLSRSSAERNIWYLLWFMLIFPQTLAVLFSEGGTTFYLLLFFAVFFFPMTVLSVIMFDSLRGLNPLLIIRSILKTFFPYCGLILLLCVLAAPVISMKKFFIAQVLSGRFGLPLYIIGVVNIYLILVAAHLLGRFYWKYEERLSWEV